MAERRPIRSQGLTRSVGAIGLQRLVANTSSSGPPQWQSIAALHCCLDDFCEVLGGSEALRLIPSQMERHCPGKRSRSEMLSIMMLFHLSPFKHFKVFYLYGIGQQHRACFGDLPHGSRLSGCVGHVAFEEMP